FDATLDPDLGWKLRFIGEPKEKGHDDKDRRFWEHKKLKEFEDKVFYDESHWDEPLRDERNFFQLLWIAIIASHDHASSLLFDKLGYLYVNSLLWQSGLFDAARGGGMWIARNYGGVQFEFWDMSGSRKPGLLVPTSRKTPDGQSITASLSAASGTAYMVLLE